MLVSISGDTLGLAREINKKSHQPTTDKEAAKETAELQTRFVNSFMHDIAAQANNGTDAAKDFEMMLKNASLKSSR